MKVIQTLVRLIAVCVALGLPAMGWTANCEKAGNDKLSATDSDAAPIAVGKINVLSDVLQPLGSVIFSTSVPPTAYTKANAEDVLWRCKKSVVDSGRVYFLVSTNGDEPGSGRWRWMNGGGFTQSANNGNGIYGTWFKNIGLKLSMGNVVLARRWKKVPLTVYDIVTRTFEGKNEVMVEIRLKHLPTMTAEVIKVGILPVNSYWSCALRSPTANGQAYDCNQPNAYIQLHPGDGSFGHDEEGEDHSDHYEMWGANNGFGYTLNKGGNSLTSHASCVVRNHTPSVTFPAVSAQQLMQGTSLQQTFNVVVECNDNVVSGTNQNQAAIGIMVSSGANHAAVVELGLTTSGGGITHLVADGYDWSQTSQGVGVTLQHPGMHPGGNLNFVRYPGTTTGGGHDAGWYPVLAGATVDQIPPSAGGYKRWHHVYTATFGRVNQLQVTPGIFKATATILVKVQ